MSDETLDGITVVSFESRLADETAGMIAKQGGNPISAPSMQEVPLEKHEAVFEFADHLFAGDVDVLICMTGVGTRMLVETLETRFERNEILTALSKLQIVARGPKPVRALKELGLPVTLKVPEPNTWKELLVILDKSSDKVPIEGCFVAVQEYGRSNEELNRGLEERGAHLFRVPIYRWALPDDLEPLREGIQAVLDGTADVAMFTSRTQADHVMQLAEQEGLANDLREAFDRVLVASIGPVCSRGLESHGMTVDFVPEHPKLGVLVRDLAEAVAERESAV
jgi:uroporphyrinogen-III synthase